MAKANQAKEDRRRRREFEARQAVHEHRVTRSKRDNLVAGIALGVVAVLVTAAQIYFFTAGPGGAVAGGETPAATEPAGTTPGATAPVANGGQVPDPAAAEGRTWTGTMTFNDAVQLGIELDGAAAPQAVANLVTLNNAHYFDGTACHRLTTAGIFVLQCGDPEGTGRGGPGYSWGPIENAPADNVYPAGTIAMARKGGDGASMGSQFFIVYEDSTIPADAAGGYTVLGRVTSGLDEFKAQLTAPGVAGGASDGAPAVPATITAIAVQ